MICGSSATAGVNSGVSGVRLVKHPADATRNDFSSGEEIQAPKTVRRLRLLRAGGFVTAFDELAQIPLIKAAQRRQHAAGGVQALTA